MPKLIRLWVLVSAACASAGWILSVFGMLNPAGYAIYMTVFGLGAWWVFMRQAGQDTGAPAPRKFHWNIARFRRPLPLLFLIIAILATIGGIMYAPNNYDALTYRVPRMLHWWAAGRWHWIATPNDRMNLSGVNFEWLMMPLFLASHSDRLFFLINIAAYFLIPSLVFLVFVRAGASRRVAWFWMWVTPAALCYAMQAGSISNDTFAVTYFLAAIYFALEAKKARSVRDLWLAALAGALLTGVKGSNLPLALPVAAAMFPALKLIKKRWLATAGVFVLGVFISYAPTAFENYLHTGDWAGDPGNVGKMKIGSPLAGCLGNGLQLALQSLEPPFLPVARSVENWLWGRFPDSLRATLTRDFPRFVIGFRELPQEESSGVGIVITVIAIISILADWFHSRKKQPASSSIWISHGMAIGLMTWAALLVYMMKLGSESTSRLIAAYYPMLLFPLILNPAQSELIRKWWFRGLALTASFVAIAAVILTPSRPLWPAQPVLDWAMKRHPQNELLPHAELIYATYRHRYDVFSQLRSNIPDSVPSIGLIEGVDDAEASLWRPFGRRKVVDICHAEKAREADLQWVVVKNRIIGSKNSTAFADWLRTTGGVVVAEQPVLEKVSAGPDLWSVVRFPPADSREIKANTNYRIAKKPEMD